MNDIVWFDEPQEIPAWWEEPYVSPMPIEYSQEFLEAHPEILAEMGYEEVGAPKPFVEPTTEEVFPVIKPKLPVNKNIVIGAILLGVGLLIR